MCVTIHNNYTYKLEHNYFATVHTAISKSEHNLNLILMRHSLVIYNRIRIQI